MNRWERTAIAALQRDRGSDITKVKENRMEEGNQNKKWKYAI